MAFTLEKVVPWGRSFDEYLAMFALVALIKASDDIKGSELQS